MTRLLPLIAGAVLLALLAIVLWVAPAPAATLAAGATGARVANNPTLATLDGMAARFWHARGVEIPAGVTYLVDIAPESPMAAYSVGVDIYMPAFLVGYVQAHPAARSAAEQLCVYDFHENGHRAGLEHTTTGLMAPTPTVVPWECVVWARNRTAAQTARRFNSPAADRAPRPDPAP